MFSFIIRRYSKKKTLELNPSILDSDQQNYFSALYPLPFTPPRCPILPKLSLLSSFNLACLSPRNGVDSPVLSPNNWGKPF